MKDISKFLLICIICAVGLFITIGGSFAVYHQAQVERSVRMKLAKGESLTGEENVYLRRHYETITGTAITADQIESSIAQTKIPPDFKYMCLGAMLICGLGLGISVQEEMKSYRWTAAIFIGLAAIFGTGFVLSFFV